MRVKIAHSPDADDAFMFYALTQGKIPTDGLAIENVLCDIETLNREAVRGTYDFTALSVAAYPAVSHLYRISPVGASVGDNYGPKVVARRPLSIQALRKTPIAVPGERTTAFLTLKLMLGDFFYAVVPFDQIVPAILEGKFEAGLIIHEGQLTFHKEKLYNVIDLGEWWFQKTGLPLPLGVNGVKKELPREVAQKTVELLGRSIAYALEHRGEALDFAMRYSRNLPRHLGDKFVGMYVNHHTVRMGGEVMRATQLLLEMGSRRGLIRPCHPEFLEA